MLPASPPPLQYDILVLLSGAEPQRTYFEQLILAQINTLSNQKIIIVRGITATNNRQQINPNLLIIDHLTTTELQQTIPDIHDSLLQLYHAGNHVIVEFISRGTAPDKTAFLLPICTIFEIKQGKIVSDYTYYDNF